MLQHSDARDGFQGEKNAADRASERGQAVKLRQTKEPSADMARLSRRKKKKEGRQAPHKTGRRNSEADDSPIPTLGTENRDRIFSPSPIK